MHYLFTHCVTDQSKSLLNCVIFHYSIYVFSSYYSFRCKYLKIHYGIPLLGAEFPLF
jgi:hypothetical protein